MKNKLIKVYHAKQPNFGMMAHPEWNNGNYTLVATFKFRLQSTPQECAEMAFGLTNSIDEPWFENTRFDWIKPGRLRSTSVGDVVTVNGVAYRFANLGIDKIKV